MPLLSICIPTRNRAEFLEATIESIVSQSEFRQPDLVEIVISNNASTDNTVEVVQKFIDRFPQQIRLSTNETDIGFGNLLKALTLGHGCFLKLNNDTLKHRPGSLAHLLEAIKGNRESKYILFFPNASAPRKDASFTSSSLDEFIHDVSYWTTWSSAFGIWKEDLEETLEIFHQQRPSEMPHAYVLMNLVAKGRKVFTDNHTLFDVYTPKKKGGYNIVHVFGHNYHEFLLEFKRQGKLSQATYERESFRILCFINGFYFDRSGRYEFERANYLQILKPYYKGTWYFFPLALVYWLKSFIPH